MLISYLLDISKYARASEEKTNPQFLSDCYFGQKLFIALSLFSQYFSRHWRHSNEQGREALALLVLTLCWESVYG